MVGRQCGWLYRAAWLAVRFGNEVRQRDGAAERRGLGNRVMGGEARRRGEVDNLVESGSCVGEV